MYARCFLVALAVTCISVVCGFVPETDLHHRLSPLLRSNSVHAFDSSLKRPLNEMPYLNASSSTRKLMQESVSPCFWTADERECAIAVLGMAELLTMADNVVADFLNRRITCFLAVDEDDCEDLDCSWLGGDSGCVVNHEELREFYSVDCLDEVRHLIEANTGDRECNPRQTEAECATFDSCYWNNDLCQFDRWQYYHDIRTVDGSPETFTEVVAARNLQLTNDIQDATDNGDIESFVNLPDWEPPAFNCPVIYEPVVCAYVDALTPFLVYNLYCSNQYPTATDIIDCNNDELCEADTSDPDNICGPSDAAVTPAARNAELAFAEGIEDSEAREYETRRIECLYISEEDECDGTCVWANDACRLSFRWSQGEVYDLVGETDDPVCQYYVLNSESGCIDLDEDECLEDSQCEYSTSREACFVTFEREVQHAMEVSDMSDMFLDTFFECEEQDSEEQCTAVMMPDETEPQRRRRGDEDDDDDVMTNLNFSVDPAVVAAPPCAVSPDTDELADIEGSLPAIVDTSPVEPSVEAEAPVTTAERDAGDEVSRIEGLGGIFGFGSR